MEKRANSRVVFHIRARLDCDGRMIEGQVHDLSLRGMFLAAEERFTEGALVEAAVDLTGDSSQLTMTLRGVVTRVETGGVGIQFEDMDVDSFIHLRNIVSHNDGDPEKIMAEFAAAAEIA